MAGFFQRLIRAIPGRRPKPDSDAERRRAEKLAQELHILRAKIDAAQTTDENRKHWGNADSLGPNAAYVEGIRETLRKRGRYETTNNSYLKSLVRSVAYDLVGTGPRPQLAFPTAKVSAEDTRKIEMRYAKWARRNKLARKYRTMHKALTRCGAGLLMFDNNDLSKDRVKFTVRGVEVDQLRTPPQYAGDLNVIDGIRLDSSGNPIEYYFLRN